MQSQKISNLRQPQALTGLTSDRNQNLTLESVTLNDGQEVKVNTQFTPSMEGQGTGEQIAKFNHDGQEYQFVVDANHQVQARDLPSDSPITGATIGVA